MRKLAICLALVAAVIAARGYSAHKWAAFAAVHDCDPHDLTRCYR